MKKSVVAALLVAMGAFAQTITDQRTSTWNGYERIDFKLDGKDCLIVKPKNPATGNPWIWRPEFFGHEPQSEVALLGKGFFAAYVNMQNSFGCPTALDTMDKFYAYVTKTYAFNAKVMLSGFSRGGLYSFNWAARNPQKIAGLYVDNPVCDFKSWPGGKGKGKGSAGDWSKLQKDYGFASEQEALAYKLNPIDNLAPIAAAKIPILGICGDADKVVPFNENFGIIKTRYEALGGKVELILKPGCDHHPHSLKDPQPITDFALKAYSLK